MVTSRRRSGVRRAGSCVSLLVRWCGDADFGRHVERFRVWHDSEFDHGAVEAGAVGDGEQDVHRSGGGWCGGGGELVELGLDRGERLEVERLPVRLRVLQCGEFGGEVGLEGGEVGFEALDVGVYLILLRS